MKSIVLILILGGWHADTSQTIYFDNIETCRYARDWFLAQARGHDSEAECFNRSGWPMPPEPVTSCANLSPYKPRPDECQE